MDELSFSDLYQVLESPDMFNSPEQLTQFFGGDYSVEDLYTVVDKETFPTLQSFQEFFNLPMTNPAGEEMDFSEQDRGTTGVKDWFKKASEKLLGMNPDEDAKAREKTRDSIISAETEKYKNDKTIDVISVSGAPIRDYKDVVKEETTEEFLPKKKKTKNEVAQELRTSLEIEYDPKDYIKNYPAPNDQGLNPKGEPKFETMEEYQAFIEEEVNVGLNQIIGFAGDKGEQIFAFDANSNEGFQNNVSTALDNVGFTDTENTTELKQYQDDYQQRLRNTIGKYGFLIEKPISFNMGMGSVSEFFDLTNYTPDDLKKELQGKRETVATKNPDQYLTITSLDGSDQFNLNIANPSKEELALFEKFVNDKARFPEEPNPEESNIAKALDIKNARTGKRFNLDTGDYSSHKMISVEIDGKYYAMPSLYPKDPNVQSTYEDRWVEFDPETQLDEIIEMANQRGEKYAFETQEEAEAFAEGAWKDYNTVDLEKERFFQAHGFEDYDGMMEAVNDYDAIRDEILLINEIQGMASQQDSQFTKRIGRALGVDEETLLAAGGDAILGDYAALDPKSKVAVGYIDRENFQFVKGERPWLSNATQVYGGNELIVDKATIDKYPKLFGKDGRMRRDWSERKVELEKMRDNLYNITQDKKFQDVSLQWDLEAAKRREAYTIEAINTKNNANMGLKALDQLSIEAFGVSSNELENYRLNNLASLDEQQIEIMDYITLAKGELEAQKIYAADQYIISQTYLNSKSIKEARGVVLEDFWPQVKNEWITRGERGKAAEYLLAMSLFSENPVKMQELMGMSRKEVAIEVSKHLENSVTKSEGMSKEMLEWNKAKGWTEAANVFMDNPLDMGASLAAGSFSEMLPYGLKIIPGFGIVGGTTGFLDAKLRRKRGFRTRGQTNFGQKVIGAGKKLNPKAWARENADLVIGALGGTVKGTMLGGSATILAMEYTTAIFEAATANGYDIFDAEEMLMAMNDPNVWNEGRSVGLARGIPIAVVDYLSARTAGKLFIGKGGLFHAGSRAEAWRRAGLVIAERAIVDPAAEAYGEYLAQSANALLNGKTFRADEIALEAIGAFGSNTSNAVMNLTMTALKNEHILKAKQMGDTQYYSGSTFNNEQTTNWANNMRKIGYIDGNTEEKIQKNIGYKRDAQLLLGLGEKGVASTELLPVQTKMMDIFNAKNQLSQNELTKQLFGKQIRVLNQELSNLATQKQVVAGEETEEANKIVNEVLGRTEESPGDLQLSQSPIADLFTNDQTFNTEEIAFDKVSLEDIKEKRIPGGTTRDVYDIGNNKVIKIAKNPRGLQQNTSLNYGDLNILGPFVPNIFERGEDYIVVENVPRNDKAVREFLKPLQKFSQTDFDNRGSEVQEVMEEMGLSDFFNYDVLWNDFKSRRNWGQRENGEFVLVDEGALNKNVTARSEVPAWAREDWENIKRRRKGDGGVQLSQAVAPLENTLLDYQYDKETGYFPSTIDNVQKLEIIVERYGYDLISTQTERGEQAGYYLAPVGSRIKQDPFKGKELTRVQRQEPDASPETREELVALLQKAFPGTQVYDNQEEFEKALKDPGVVKRTTKDGYVAYGATRDGKIYLNPDDKTLELPLHEFGHIYVDYLKSNQSGAKGTALYKRGLQLITSTEDGEKIYNQQVKIYGEGDQAREEALIIYIAQEGAKKTKEAERQTKNKLYKWYEALMNFIKNAYLKAKDFFKSPTFEQDVKGMSLTDFVNMALGDLLGGEVVVEDVIVDETGQTKLALSQQKKVPRGSNMVEVVTEARELGISDDQIKAVLVERVNRGENIGVRGEERFTRQDINDAFTALPTEIVSLPPAFRNIEGGFFRGMALFTEVQNIVNKAIGVGTTTEVRKRHIDSVKKRFPKATKGKSTAQILRLFPIDETILEGLKSPAEIRKIGLDALKASPLYAAQSPKVQEQLVVDYDKELGIRANRNVQLEVNKIKNTLRARKQGAKDVATAKKDLAKLINLIFPKTDLINRSDLTYMNNRIAAVNDANQLAEIENVLSRIAKVEDRIKKDLISKIKKLIQNQSKTNVTATGKTRKGAQIDVTTKEFFVAAKALLDTYDTPQGLEIFAKEMNELANLENTISKLRDKENKTREDRELIARADAFSVLGDLHQMNLAEVEQLFDDLKNKRQLGRSLHQAEQEERKAELAKLEQEADEQIKKTNKDLFFEDGTPKNQDTLNSEGRNALAGYKKSGFVNSMKKLQKNFLDFDNFKRVMQEMKLNAYDMMAMGHVLYSSLDNRNGKFLLNNIYYRLTDAEENYNSIFFDFRDRLTEIAHEVLGKKKYSNILAERFGLKWNDVDAYQYITVLADNGKTILIEGVNPQNKLSTQNTPLTTSEAMRIIALWKNPESKIILQNDGFTQEKINKLEKFIGKDLTTFVDKVVGFLTDEVYPIINAKHREIYGVNLPFRELYFPRATQPIIGQPKSYGFDVDAQSNLNAIRSMLPGSLSETASPNNLRMILTDMNFFNTLDNYIDDVARWTGYATDVKIIEGIISMPSVEALLSTTGMKEMIIYNINVAIDPSGKTRTPNKTRAISNGISMVTSYFLSLHPMQYLKQASSVVMAYPLYNNPKFKVFKQTKKAGDTLFTGSGIKNIATNTVELLWNTAAFALNEPANISAFMTQIVKEFAPGNYAKNKELAKKISATFRKRNWESKSGNLYMLYTGRERADLIDSTPEGIERKKRAQSYDIIKKAFGFFTSEGDLAGAMGYIIVYKNMIANGFTHEEALRVFNDYNLTNQSRRGIDKPGLQSQKSGTAQVFSAFTTTPIQILNNTYLSFMNFFKDVFRNVTPSGKDFNTFGWVGFISVMLFHAVSSMWLLLLGDKDDREKFWEQVLKWHGIQAMMDAIPMVNETISAFINEVEGTPYKKGKDSTTMPPVEVAEELGKWVRNEEGRNIFEQTLKALYEFTQFRVRAQFDIFEYPLQQAVEGENHWVYDFLRMMRVPKSRIPARFLPKQGGEGRRKTYKKKKRTRQK